MGFRLRPYLHHICMNYSFSAFIHVGQARAEQKDYLPPPPLGRFEKNIRSLRVPTCIHLSSQPFSFHSSKLLFCCVIYLAPNTPNPAGELTMLLTSLADHFAALPVADSTFVCQTTHIIDIYMQLRYVIQWF